MNKIRYFLLPTIIAGCFISAWVNPVHAAPAAADWCQCVIFVLNYLGIRQIPGEYWTAASLAVPDQMGKTWMDYQGYAKRMDDELPETGDLLVLANGAEVITEQTWDGVDHLVPVMVDVWAGHLGIVLGSENVKIDGEYYWRIRLLSANWGVSSHALGVVGSCFNVDESTFLVPIGYKKASFFYAVDAGRMRERMVNRANRWAMLGLESNPQSSIDGFPINPSGLISQVLEPVGPQPLIPAISNIAPLLVQVPVENTLPGDIIIFGEERNPGLGVINSITGVEKENSWSGEVVSMIPGARVVGPEKWDFQYSRNIWTRGTQTDSGDYSSIRFFRYIKIPPYPVIQNFQIRNEDEPGKMHFNLTLINGGGQVLHLQGLTLVVEAIGSVDNEVKRLVSTQEIKTSLPVDLAGNFTASGTFILKETELARVSVQYEDPLAGPRPLAQVDVTIN